VITIAFTLLFVGLAQISDAAQQEAITLSTVEQIQDEFSRVPCDSGKRLDAVKALFERMGASPSALSIEKLSSVENVIVRHEGMSAETIVIGAHYDLAELGCGAVDNWTGIVAIAHVYRSIQNFKGQKTVIFAAFGKEERGLVGSRAMVKAISKDQIPQYCAMINIDSFGLAAPFALKQSSTEKLVHLADELANKMNMPFAGVAIPGTDSDSSSFKDKGIPAVTLSGLSADWPKILHTTSDQPKQVLPISVYLGYRLALAMWNSIEQAPCDAYR
jgi:Zn-dependent M28 family amino/carboxypeptidase